MAFLEYLPAITDDDLGGVLVGHDDGGARQSAPVGVRVVGLERLAGHASVQVVSHFEHIPVDRNNSHQVVKANKKRAFVGDGHLKNKRRATYEEKEVVSLDRFLLESTGFWLGLGKATQTAWPFFMRTALLEVTLVF